jgi:capsule polysaccharide modification protein KpsS
MNNNLLVSRHSKIRFIERVLSSKHTLSDEMLEFAEKLIIDSLIVKIHPLNADLEIHKFRLQGYHDFVAICERKENGSWLVKTIVDKFVRLRQGE